MKAMKIAGSAVAAITVIAILLLFIGIPSGFLTSSIRERVERETGYQLTVAGSTRLGLWPSPNVKMNDVTLEGPGDRDTGSRLVVASIKADTTLRSLWSGQPEITELTIDRPILSVPLLRERRLMQKPPPSKQTSASAAADSDGLRVDRITVNEGTVIFSNVRDRVEDRIEGISLNAVVGADRKVSVTGQARASDRPLKFSIQAITPVPPLERQNIPLEFNLDSAGVLPAPLSGKAEVRFNGSLVMINGLSGKIGDGVFNGWASVDISSKPLVKLDLDFQRLDIATAQAGSRDSQTSSQPSSQPSSQSSNLSWSNTTIDLVGLNYVDVQARVSAAELNVGQAQFAPAAIDSTLAGGMLKCSISNLGAYGGQANGELGIDVSSATPTYTFRSDLVGVRALPLLRSAAGFDKLDGKLQAKIAVRSAGQSQRAIMSNLAGTVFANFQDGAIQGLNVAQMIRNLTTGTLSGWQESREQTTDLAQFSASFRIDKGQATTTDLNLVGPLVRMTGAGTIDLNTRMMAFRVEPKLVMTTEGQGRTADPVSFGIPVMIDGPWTEPRIYPEVAGMLDNPDAAYAKLKEMGKGLIGAGGSGGLGGGSPGGGLPNVLGGGLGETIGNLLQQGLGQGSGQGSGQGTGQGAGQGTAQGGGQATGRNRGQGRNLQQPAQNPPPAQAQAPQGDPAPQAQQESQPMNDVLRQLFNR
jgi:AsmA protein